MATVDGVAVGAAAVAFLVAEIDEFVVLVVYFSRAVAGQMKRVDVIVGQVLGFTIICALSLLGLLLGAYVPQGYIQLIGEDS